MSTTPTLYMIVVALVLILLLGIVAVAVIAMIARRCRCKSDNKLLDPTDLAVDPWEEAGRRHK
ncbi:MAG: hypothetical protein QGI78_05765 [Phycisphaerales bacterium]|jgi:hypothetical protein|nr:hypothetical protein [Phycisphaerales bacterium]